MQASVRLLRLSCVCLAVAVLLLVAGAAAGGAGPAGRPGACRWGASSIVAEAVGGKVVTSQPHTSGCVPS